MKSIIFIVVFINSLVLICATPDNTNNVNTPNKSRHHYASHNHHRHHNRHHFIKTSKLNSRNLDQHMVPNKENHSLNNVDNNLPHDSIASVVGKTVELDCMMKNFTKDEKIVWLRMPKGEVLTLNSNRIVQDSRIYSKCNKLIFPCWVLVIESLKETDSGYYVCQTNAMQTKYIYLDVLVPPQLLTTHNIDKIDVNENNNVTLTCETHGKPPPNLAWFKGSNGSFVEIEKFHNLKTITFLVNRYSNTELECVADNGVPPTVSKKIFINIKFSPRIDISNNRIYQKQGRDVIIDCMANSNPEPKMQWFKNDVQITDSNKYVLTMFRNRNNYYYRLFIKELNYDDFGMYKCTALNELNETHANMELIELIDPNSYRIEFKTKTQETIPTKMDIFTIPIVTTTKHVNIETTTTINIESSKHTKNKNAKNTKYTTDSYVNNGNQSTIKNLKNLKETRRKLENFSTKADLRMIDLYSNSSFNYNFKTYKIYLLIVYISLYFII